MDLGALGDELDTPDIPLQSKNGPRTREELLARLPERSIADRLIMRYFTCMSPSQRKISPNRSVTSC
jgi:hypothetical protein